MSAVLWQRRRIALLAQPFNWHEITEAEFVEQSGNPAYAGNYEYRALYDHPARGVVDEVIATLDEIGGLTRALRHGGPAPEDLQGLSDALTEATNMAHEAMHALQAAALPAVPENTAFDPFEPTWPEGLGHGDQYELRCDDMGRNGGSWLRIFVANDGDVHVRMQQWEDMPEGEPFPIPGLRCRTWQGGGRHGRTHQALLWLAQAIRLDTLAATQAHDQPEGSGND